MRQPVQPSTEGATSDQPVVRLPEDLLGLWRSGGLNPHTVSWKEEVLLRRWARDGEAISQRRISRLIENQAHNNARRARSRHMNKLAVRLKALCEAARRNWKTRSGMTPEEREALRLRRLAEIFTALPAASDLSRPAQAFQFSRRKPNGGTRQLTKFLWVDDARLRVLKSALTPFASFHHGQFMHAQSGRRRGSASVREALLQALREVGDGHVFLQFDIRDFYGSISHKWLEENLGLDRGIVRRFVHTGEMHIVPVEATRTVRRHDEARKENDRRGFSIPQGSALSSLIAEWVMAHILRSDAAFDRVRLFAWSDNLGVLVPRGEACPFEELIRAAFERHGAGPFHLTVAPLVPVTSEFRFLGVWYRVAEGTPVAYIPAAVADGWERSVCEDILTSDAAELALAYQRVMGKYAAWRWWPGMEARVRSVVTTLQSASEALAKVAEARQR